MATSNLYSFSPSSADVVLSAYARIGLRRTALTAEHLRDAADESNYLLVEISNKIPNLWTSGTQTLALVAGTATYSLNIQAIMVLAAYLRSGTGEDTFDKLLGPISTVEYEAIPNKLLRGEPTIFWLDRQITPTVVVWPTPDDSYSLILRTVRQVQDASLPSGVTNEIPYRALDAFVAGLAARLARIHAPAMEAERKKDAIEAWNIFANNDVEGMPMFITPMIGNYSP